MIVVVILKVNNRKFQKTNSKKQKKRSNQRRTWENQKYDLFIKLQILNHPDPSYSKHRIQISE